MVHKWICWKIIAWLYLSCVWIRSRYWLLTLVNYNVHVGICVCSEPYQISIIQILISDVWTTPTLGSLAMRNLLPPYSINVGLNNISLYKSLIKLSLVWQMFAISSNLYNINDPGGLAVLVLGLGEIPVKIKFCTWNFASYVFGTKIQF